MVTDSNEGVAPHEMTELQRSSRDLQALRSALLSSVATHLPGDGDLSISELRSTSSTGMSSETFLFDVTYERDGAQQVEELVARVAPDSADIPVFPEYDLPAQFRSIETVAATSDVPVPPPRYCEPDPAVIGSPFFVMGRVEGVVPPDVMPYTFGGNWLFDASREDQRRLQDASVGVIADLHAIDDPLERFAHLTERARGQSPLHSHFAHRRAWYEWAAQDCGRSTLVEGGFRWLEDHWPAHESEARLSWGDSRIGNVLYRDFEPVGVLDWEMAAVGPPELDLAWMIHLHRFFQDLAVSFGMEGMPHFMLPEDAATTYEKLTGRTPRDLDWYMTYSCVQMGIVFLRTGWRAVHFGEREHPNDPNELLTNVQMLIAMTA